MAPTETTRWLFILALAGFVLAGRGFLAAIRSEVAADRRRAVIYGLIVVACFLLLAFFQIRL